MSRDARAELTRSQIIILDRPVENIEAIDDLDLMEGVRSRNEETGST